MLLQTKKTYARGHIRRHFRLSEARGGGGLLPDSAACTIINYFGRDKITIDKDNDNGNHNHDDNEAEFFFSLVEISLVET